MIRLWFVLIVILALIIGCREDNKNPTGENNPPPIEKSFKRGLAFDMTLSADFDTLKGGVSWWYNWYYKTLAPAGYYEDYQMEFIPMLWGGNTTVDFELTKNFILEHPEIEYLLVLNEPNLTNQANRTPAQAAADWLKYEQLISDLATAGRTIKLVGPAITWGTMENYQDPVKWMDAFLSAYKSANGGREPKIDYLAFHWYDYGLSEQLDRLKKYGKKVWITEMANWNAQITTYEQQMAQMTEMVTLCESRSDVFRYAWFIGRGDFPDSHHTYLFNPNPGELNELGRLYLSLPYPK